MLYMATFIAIPGSSSSPVSWLAYASHKFGYLVNLQPSSSSSTVFATLHVLALLISCVVRVPHVAPMQPEVSIAFCRESSCQPKT